MTGTFTKQIIDNQLYLYNAKGELIFKRWLNHGYSRIIDVMAYSTRDSLQSITEQNGKILIKNNV